MSGLVIILGDHSVLPTAELIYVDFVKAEVDFFILLRVGAELL